MVQGVTIPQLSSYMLEIIRAYVFRKFLSDNIDKKSKAEFHSCQNLVYSSRIN